MFLTYSLLNASHDNSLVMYAPRYQKVIFEEKLTVYRRCDGKV